MWALRHSLLAVVVCASAFGHAPPVYIPSPPLQVRDASIVDRTGKRVLFRGVVYDALELESPNPVAYRAIRQRWNLNTVRIPLRVARWSEQPDYLDRAAKAVQSARSEGLIVVLAADETASVEFWNDVAARFRDESGVVFSLIEKPQATDWASWRSKMQSLAESVRNAGATSQILSASAPRDGLGFQGILPEYYINGPNIMYEVHPSYTQESTDAQRQANFGFLSRLVPIYAGSFGMPLGSDSAECRALPSDPSELTLLLLQTLAWFDESNVSWTINAFADFDTFEPTEMPVAAAPPCDDSSVTKVGIGTTVLLWTTGDLLGFGSILTELTASLAGGPPGDFAPGQLVAFYGQELGPSEPVTAPPGSLPTELGGVRVYFNSIPVPIVYADSFQVSVQVPYEIANEPSVDVQLYFRDVPSNRIRFGVAPAAPQPFAQRGSLSDALARNEDGTLNSVSNPAARGSLVVVSATGSGQTNPAGVTGVPGTGVPLLATSVTVGQRPAEFVYWRGSATEAGREEIAVRIPSDLPGNGGAQRFALVLGVGRYTSRAGVSVWVR